jgi:hypothetical protein
VAIIKALAERYLACLKNSGATLMWRKLKL